MAYYTTECGYIMISERGKQSLPPITQTAPQLLSYKVLGLVPHGMWKTTTQARAMEL